MPFINIGSGSLRSKMADTARIPSHGKRDRADQDFVIGNTSRLQAGHYNIYYTQSSAPSPCSRSRTPCNPIPFPVASPVHPVIKNSRLVAGMVQSPHDTVAGAGSQGTHDQSLQGAPETGLAGADGDPILHEAEDE